MTRSIWDKHNDRRNSYVRKITGEDPMDGHYETPGGIQLPESVAKDAPKEPERVQFSELPHGERKRLKIYALLDMLQYELGIGSAGSIMGLGYQSQCALNNAYRDLAKMVLGDDRPGYEEKT